jgi:hypothetical protein
MKMAMTEAPFSLTIKVGPKGELLTCRAETAADMKARVADLRDIEQTLLQGTMQEQPQAAPTVEQAVQNLQDAGMVAAPSGGIEQRQDRFNNDYTRGVPDAGTCIHGGRIVKNATNKSGKRYKAYVCVNDSPFREGKYDANAICEIAWPAK